MAGQDDPVTRLRRRLEAALDGGSDDSVSWQVTADRAVTIPCPDRELTVEHRDGPTGIRWTVVLCADGAVVGKYGQFDTIDAVLDRVFVPSRCRCSVHRLL